MVDFFSALSGNVRGLRKKLPIFLRQLSIRNRLFILFITQILFSIIWCGYIVFISFQNEISTVSASNSRVINTITLNLQNEMNTLASITKYPVLQTPNRTLIYNYLSNPQNSSTFRYELYTTVQADCNQLFELYPNIRNIVFYMNNGNGIKCISKNEPSSNMFRQYNYSLINTDLKTDWVNQVLSLNGSVLFLPHSLTENDQTFSNRNTSLYAGRSIINSDTVKSIGIILARCDITDSIKAYENNRKFSSQCFGIYDSLGSCVVGDIPEERLKNISTSIFPKQNQTKSAITFASKILIVNGKKMMYDYSTAVNGYVVVVETPYGKILLGALQKQIALFVLLFVLLLLLIFMIQQIILSITKPISKLMTACNTIQSGDFSIQINNTGNDELSEFTESFNSMTKEIKDLIYEGYEKDLLHNQLELQMLRAQINPHFLYNTLESIHATAYLNGEETLSEMAVLLGKTLRYGISTPTDVVSVHMEIENLENYIRLQKLRYGEKLDFIVNIDQSIMSDSIIKVLLQPVVENAIYHGISSIAAGGLIQVMGYRDFSNIVFKVIDNGTGISEDSLHNLNGYINNENEEYKSIGLKNVNRRIQLYYGDDYGLVITSIIGRGTMVTITIPNHINLSAEEDC